MAKITIFLVRLQLLLVISNDYDIILCMKMHGGGLLLCNH